MIFRYRASGYHSIAALIISLLISGCNRHAVVEDNTSLTSVYVTDSQFAVQQEPGNWEMSTRVTAKDGESPPPAAAKWLLRGDNNPGVHNLTVGKDYKTKYCMPDNMVKFGGSNFMVHTNMPDCKVDHYAASKGEVEANWTCRPPGSTIHTSINGTYDSDSDHVTSTTETQTPDGRHYRLTYETSHRRTGACSADNGSNAPALSQKRPDSQQIQKNPWSL